MDISDPRLAQLITDLVDRRIRAFAEASQQVRYGIVAAVDAANRRVSVRVGASTVATPGFVYAAGYMRPVAGDLVRVVVAGADRYVDAVLSGAPFLPAGLYTPVPLVEVANVNSANNTAIPTTDVDMSALPTGLRAVSGIMRGNPTTIVPTSPTLCQLFGYGEAGVSAWIALQGRPIGVAQGTGFVANTGGPNGRSIQYRTNQAAGGGVVNLVIGVNGYWK